ncbi:MAG TPA: enoyl-CoA hydratase [Firmicutes bacterium]|nr:enoyl-CoA hydratase [Bacillota bacterium]
MYVSGLVQVSREGRLGIVVINNPPVNALNGGVISSLQGCMASLALESDLGAVVITGAGNKAFIAGADISEFPALSGEEGEKLSRKGQLLFQQVANLPVPVIAAINGFALGGGLELALACDIRVASESARLGLPEVSLAVMPGYGGTQRLPRAIALGKAKELIFTGEMIPATEALRIGLLEHVVSDGEALVKAKQIASTILKRGPVAVRMAKQAVNRGLELSLEEGLKLEASLFRVLFDTEDKNEGATAFLEKRSPEFKGS